MLEIKLKDYLNNYFDSLIEYKHLALRTNTILFNDLKRFDSEDSKLRFASSLVLRDWSGETGKNGGSYAYPTESKLETTKESYPEFIHDLISKQFCFFYVQSFEGLERLLKNFIFELALIDAELKIFVESKLKKDQNFLRKNMPSGDHLRKIVDAQLDSFLYGKDKMQFNLKTSFSILSETRHNIVHNNNILNKSKMLCPKDKENLFTDLFMYDEIDNENIRVKLDILHFKELMDFMCQFSFQIFKKLCIKYDLNWKVYKNMDKY